MNRIQRFRLPLLVASGTMLASTFLLAEDAPPFDPNQLMQEVVQNEVHFATHDRIHWMFRQQHSAPDNEVKECIETVDGTICRCLLRNGQPLSGKEQEKESQRLQQLATDSERQRREQKDRAEDAQKALQMLRMLPGAFHYQFQGYSDGYVRLKFELNPKFEPSTRETKVFHGMAGFMLIEPRKKRLAAIQGKLVKDVVFGAGILGRLDKGGTFEVQRVNLGSGDWETSLLDVNIHGKALFFKTIRAQQHEINTNFRQVPNNLTIAQAASMLETPSLQARVGEH